MLRRRLWWAGLIAGAVGLVIYFRPAGKPEPSYEGRSLSEWLRVAEWADGREVSEATVKPDEAFAAMGTNMIPFLLDWLEEKPSAASDYAARLREARGWRWIPLWATSRSQRERAEHGRRALYALSAAGEATIPRLVRLMHNPNPMDNEPPVLALWSIGPSAIPAWAQILSDPGADRDLRVFSARVLCGFFSDPRPGSISPGQVTAAMTALNQTLGDTNKFLASRAADCLSGVREYEFQPERGIAELSCALQDPDWFVRFYAIKSLAVFGTRAVPTLRLALQDENGSVRRMATNTLRRIDPQAFGNLPIP